LENSARGPTISTEHVWSYVITNKITRELRIGEKGGGKRDIVTEKYRTEINVH
jgi:hypothetical protein